MSRVGNLPISLPKGVDVQLSKSNLVTVKGPKGTLHEQIDPDITVTMADGTMTFARPTEQNRHKSMHGLSRALISNMITGVTNGYTRTLELVGVGYRVTNTGNLLEIIVGYSHPIYFYVPNEVKVETKTEKGSNPMIILTSTDKQLLGQVAAKIRSYRKPEPYKGKGIKYLGEILRRKAGKTSGKK
ncbi:MAG TPA: 50S ribosomal protein L6 [Saprospiraceae bacterium]|nr:50S ribosomal protein L6 [Saprospiraceae bacterium]